MNPASQMYSNVWYISSVFVCKTYGRNYIVRIKTEQEESNAWHKAELEESNTLNKQNMSKRFEQLSFINICE